MSDISPSKITTDAEFEKQIANADFETIKVLMADRAVALGVVQRDIFDPSVLIETEAATQPQPQKFARSEMIAGRKVIFEADSPLELERQVGAAYKTAEALHSTTQTTERNERGQVAAVNQSAEDAATRAHLELEFKRGSITVEDFLARSGAIERHLASQGVSVPELQAAIAERRDQQFTSSWEDATQAFMVKHPDWHGGEANRQVVAEIISTNPNLMDAPDKLAALEAAYIHARDNGLLVVNPAVEAVQKINDARSVEEIRQVLRPGSSSMFGR